MLIIQKHFTFKGAYSIIRMKTITKLIGAIDVTGNHYSTAAFEKKYTYTGRDLGAVWSKEATTFRIWAPTAESVKLRLYRSGTHGVQDLLDQLDMAPDVRGTWSLRMPGDWNGIYYTYLVERDDVIVDACDPYARSTGVNGLRAMVLNLDATDPIGWERDKNPQAGRAPVDAIVYELHLRDLSSDRSSGIQHKGKFLGLTETGTKNAYGHPTGLDHIKKMGVTHIQILPMYDFGSVDEADPESNGYNWGYDPVNYNVPEGSYSTDPYHGEVRVREMKQMVQAIHNAGMGVIMDVVYNHVYDAGRFCFNRIVPGYFSRCDRYGRYSNGSGCGNDTASERSMVRKYIVDSVLYWAEEYHIDGFRFDLAGLLDVHTIREAMAAVHAVRPDVLFYGEGWHMESHLTKREVQLVNQSNAKLVPGFGFFNDTARDALKGSVFEDREPGYISGATGKEEEIRDVFLGINHWCADPVQTVNYVSCHDNMALYDRLALSAPHADDAQRRRMNCLGAAVCMLSQGMPLMQAGEELLRSKPLPGGGFDENSYKSPDSVNSIKWNTLRKKEYRTVREYYRGLIAFRKAHSALRRASAQEVLGNILSVSGLPANVTAFQIRGGCPGEPSKAIFVIFNPNPDHVLVSLPNGKWNICIQDDLAGVKPLGTAQGLVKVAGISTTVLTLDETTGVIK